MDKPQLVLGYGKIQIQHAQQQQADHQQQQADQELTGGYAAPSAPPLDADATRPNLGPSPVPVQLTPVAYPQMNNQ